MRLATDTGGTFTDLIIEDDNGSITLYKAPTVPWDPVAGVLDALTVAAESRGVSLRELLASSATFIHGTTHALNAIVTGNVARTALIVTQGHRDILLFREGGRTEPFNHTIAYPKPYIPRSLTFEAPERVTGTGEVLVALEDAAVLRILDAIRETKAEAVAVSLLWSTVRPDHELRIGELIQKHLPEIPYTLSHVVNATLREFRRTSSAAIDASLKPLMSAYLGGLTERLRAAGFSGNVAVLTSGGGMMDAADIAASPIRVINSGPSMAPVAGRYYADRDGGFATAIVADTGGTTYDISLVSDGRIPMTRDLWIGQPYRGHLAGYPSVDVKSVGAGGGSIATIDTAGLLHVGPRSAGSYPGPVCYGRGGKDPTVTDACVVLGYIDPDFFLGGKMPLDGDGARRTISEQIAGRLGLGLEQASWSILDLATENMVQAIQELTVNQGIDPAEAVLVGGGGAAGLNSVFVARRLGCRRLLIPETGAAMSAAGAMMSDVASEFSTTVYSSTGRFDHDAVNRAVDDLELKCDAFAKRAGLAGLTTYIAEARYEGQAWEIEVPLACSRFRSADDVASFRATFDRLHQQIFAIQDPGSLVELMGLRATIRCEVRENSAFPLNGSGARARAARSRSVYFPDTGFAPTPVLDWSTIPSDRHQAGPAIVESPFTTVVIDSRSSYCRTPDGALLIEVSA
jgi:N-methylhydantoinase A